MNFRIYAAALAAAAAFLAPAAMAKQEAISFTLHNETDYVLVALYISIPSTNDWEEDIFGADVLGSGESIEIAIDDGLSDCVYDVRADFDDGDSVQIARVNFCELDGSDLSISE